MDCKDIGFGTYKCTYHIMLPWLTKNPCDPEGELREYMPAVDKCLVAEVINLWEMGIKTTGCCCGHGDQEFAFIGVEPEYIPRMKALGYKVKFNACRPNDEDSFIPMTAIKYGTADKGFNWWDNSAK